MGCLGIMVGRNGWRGGSPVDKSLIFLCLRPPLQTGTVIVSTLPAPLRQQFLVFPNKKSSHDVWVQKIIKKTAPMEFRSKQDLLPVVTRLLASPTTSTTSTTTSLVFPASPKPTQTLRTSFPSTQHECHLNPRAPRVQRAPKALEVNVDHLQDQEEDANDPLHRLSLHQEALVMLALWQTQTLLFA